MYQSSLVAVVVVSADYDSRSYQRLEEIVPPCPKSHCVDVVVAAAEADNSYPTIHLLHGLQAPDGVHRVNYQWHVAVVEEPVLKLVRHQKHQNERPVPAPWAAALIAVVVRSLEVFGNLRHRHHHPLRPRDE